MKQNILNRLLSACSYPTAMAVILAGAMSVACKEDTGGLLPEGTYPVIPTAVVRTIPQENGTEAWAGDEQVAVQGADVLDVWTNAETGIYDVAADGILTSSEPVWWKSEGERMKVRAWFCGDGSTAEGGENASAIPSVWTVQADQSGDGYNAGRLLYAPEKEATFAPSRIVPLTFYHQTAKIVMNVNASAAVTSADQIQSIRINGMTLSGNWSAPEASETTGTWTVDADAAKSDVTLYELSTPEGSALSTYAGYAVPQAMAGLTVTVTTDKGSVTATLDSDVDPLTAGNVGTFMLTVNSDNLVADALKLETEFTADQFKFGDYFYSDGTTSDGGLRGIYSNGSLKMEDPKPGPVSDKQVVGIVFQTNPDRIGQAEKEAVGYTDGDAIGLAISLKNAATDVTWGPNTGQVMETQVRNYVGKDIYNEINGYANYTHLITTQAAAIDSYPAFKAVMDFNETGCPITGSNTTGWFLPSTGQMWDVMQILGACAPLADPANQTDNSGKGWQFQFTGLAGYTDKLNAWMGTVVEGSKDVFVAGGARVGTSTERNNTNAWYLIFNQDDFYFQGGSKQDQYKADIRPVIAFNLSGLTTPAEPTE